MPGLEAGTIEKIIMAIIMVICIILLAVGISYLAQSSWTTGSILTLLGVGGIGGIIYWIRNPMIHQGSGEEDMYDGSPIRELCDCEDLSEKFEEDMMGAHEDEMMSDLHSLVEALKSGDTEKLKDIEESTKSTHEHAEKNFSEIIKLLDETLKDSAPLRDSYDKLGEEHKKQVSHILRKYKELNNLVSKESHEIAQKISELESALGITQ
jgi:gas vesicle protein